MTPKLLIASNCRSNLTKAAKEEIPAKREQSQHRQTKTNDVKYNACTILERHLGLLRKNNFALHPRERLF